MLRLRSLATSRECEARGDWSDSIDLHEQDRKERKIAKICISEDGHLERHARPDPFGFNGWSVHALDREQHSGIEKIPPQPVQEAGQGSPIERAVKIRSSPTRTVHMATSQWTIDYSPIVSATKEANYDDLAALLAAQLTELWCEAYRAGIPHVTNIHSLIDNGFEYWFDFSTELRGRGVLQPDSAADRLVLFMEDLDQ